jgi:hypothetical protein
MPDIFRDQPGVQLAVGAVITVFVWGLYIVRVVFGVGPMRDHEGNQAPALHYSFGASIVTGIVVVWWIVARAIFTHYQKRSGKPPGGKA